MVFLQLMIFPTLIIAVIICWRNRRDVSETAHNSAIVFWITANSYWMVSEFLHFDTNILIAPYTYKHLATIPFAIGIIILGWYYLWWPLQNKKNAIVNH